MKHLEGDAYANFHYSNDYTGPDFYRCKCGVFGTDEYRITHGDRCDECGYHFELDESEELVENWMSQNDTQRSYERE